MRFNIRLDKRSKICVKEFLQLNYLKFYDRYLQFTASDVIRFYDDQCPNYFDEFPCYAGDNSVIMRSSNKKIKLPFRETKLKTQDLA